jgi:hypothetical protein
MVSETGSEKELKLTEEDWMDLDMMRKVLEVDTYFLFLIGY